MLKKMIVVLGFAATVLAVACGGGGGQSQECKDYLACADKIGGTYKDSAHTSFDSTSSCWTNSATADSCTASCKSSLSSAKTAYPDAGC